MSIDYCNSLHLPGTARQCFTHSTFSYVFPHAFILPTAGCPLHHDKNLNVMMHGDSLILLLRIFIIAYAIEASPLPSYTIFLHPRWLEIAESAAIVGAAGDGKKCSSKEPVQGGLWWAFLFVVIALIALTGLLAGLTLAVMSVDLARLKVWTEIGDAKQKFVLSEACCTDSSSPESTEFASHVPRSGFCHGC